MIEQSGETWDAHAHVIGDPGRFPFASGRAYTPPPAPLETYLAMLDSHAIARGVLVQPSVYEFDNSCLIDALDRSDGRLAGIVVPPPDSTPRDLEAMHRRGVRGVRWNLINPGCLPIDTVVGWQPVLRALGWHVELHIAVDEIGDLPSMLQRFSVPVVIDHMGRPAPGRWSRSSPGILQLVEFVRQAACFVKLSAPYRLTDTGAPWADVVPLARALVAANADNCLWGTDWPHVHTTEAVRSDDLLAARDRWCMDAETARTVMTVAARALYAG